MLTDNAVEKRWTAGVSDGYEDNFKKMHQPKSTVAIGVYHKLIRRSNGGRLLYLLLQPHPSLTFVKIAFGVNHMSVYPSVGDL